MPAGLRVSSCSEPEQFYEKYRENVEVTHCWTKPYRRRRRRDDTTEGEHSAKKETPEPDVRRVDKETRNEKRDEGSE